MAGGHIELVSLSKRFVEMAVDDVDLVISSGEFFPCSGRPAAARPRRSG
jgi:hypothetical protein